MAVKHIGYGLVDENGDPAKGCDGNIIFVDDREIIHDIAEMFSAYKYKVVRVLIDDEVEK